MPFTVNPNRRVKFNAVYKDESGDETQNIEYSVTFDFIIAEDVDYGELRSKLEDKTPVEIIDPKTNKPQIDPKTEKPIETAGMMNAYLYTLRTSLVACSGIEDPDGNEITIKDDDGNIIEANQKAVFEAIRMDSELFDRIQTAYLGTKGKN